MADLNISVSKDFSTTPGPRYIKEGDFSAEEFRKTIFDAKFKEALSENKKLIIDLDGTLGYGTSFLEELFGGLTREYGQENVNKTLKIISKEEEYLLDDIRGYIRDANKGHEQ